MSYLIRSAALQDVPGIVDLGLEALNSDPYDNLIVCKEKVEKAAIECVASASNFSWIAEEDGKIIGAVSALVHDMLFHERKQATVIQFYCNKTGRGIGTELIEIFLKWAESRRIIKMVVFTLECRSAPEVGELLSRLGLNQELPVYLKIKGES